VDTGSREENAPKQKIRASVLIQSEPILLETASIPDGAAPTSRNFNAPGHVALQQSFLTRKLLFNSVACRPESAEMLAGGLHPA
jgi:hypothetical protein